MKKLILHIPHASTFVPSYDGFCVDKKTIDREIQIHTDWFTDELFHQINARTIRASVSRVFCDMERYEDNELEPMYSCGRGALYTKSDDGMTIRVVNKEQREEILNNYYRPHHHQLTESVSNELEASGGALIIDCHSFPSKPLKTDQDQTADRPNICIGIVEYHTPQSLIDFTRKSFESKGLSTLINAPYSGCIIPEIYKNKNRKVLSIMIEVNRSIYMNEPLTLKKAEFYTVKKTLNEYLEEVNKWHMDYMRRIEKMSKNQKQLSGFMQKINGEVEMDDETLKWWLNRY